MASIDHEYLVKCIRKYNFQPWIVNFLQDLLSKWNLDIRSGKETILEKKIGRGILQGDSLSPLLFVLCMDPLSRKLNGLYPKVSVKTETGIHISNHLLFIDDLKLFSSDQNVLVDMLAEVKTFFNTVGLEMNREKSATNCEACENEAELLDGTKSYKYLGIIENSASEVNNKQSIEKIKAEIIKRTERLCKTKLNAKNLFKAINEHAISVINYHIGVLKLEANDFFELDNAIRQVLIMNKVHQQPSCKERLYLPREMLGRGLQSIEHRSELMLLELRNDLEADKTISTRRAAILKVEDDNKTHLFLINHFLKAKYKLDELAVNSKILREAQHKTLNSEIKSKTLHEKLFRCLGNELIDIKDSSIWLKHGNNSAREEAKFCAIQDRNIFMGEDAICPHCRSNKKTVDHLATRCDRMLGNDYMRRHNEVVRSIHLLLCNKYGFKRTNKIRSHSVQEIISNDNAEIKVDTRIKTDIKIQCDRPDIFIYDKKRKEVILIEIGITNQDLLTQVENEKMRKYDLLANELALTYKSRSKIIPYVMTWDGIVSVFHKKYVKDLGITKNIEAYIQSKVLKKTLESITFDQRRGSAEEVDDYRGVEDRVMKLSIADVGPPAESISEKDTN